MNVEDRLLLSEHQADLLLEHQADPRDLAHTRRVDSRQTITHPDSMAPQEDPVGSAMDHHRSPTAVLLSEMALPLRLELIMRVAADLHSEVKTLECVEAAEASGVELVVVEEAPQWVVEDSEIEVVNRVRYHIHHRRTTYLDVSKM